MTVPMAPTISACFWILLMIGGVVRSRCACGIRGVVLMQTPLSRIYLAPRAAEARLLGAPPSPPGPGFPWRRLRQSRACPRLPEFGRFGSNILARRDIGGRGVLAQLQRPDVGRDAPAVAGRNLRGIIEHDSESIGHYVVEISQRNFLQPGNVI